MRKLLILFLSVIALLLAGYAGLRGYRVWKQNHMYTLARGFLAKSDPQNALLSLGEVLRCNPRHVEATRMVATLLEARRSPSTLLWRSRVVELSPHSAVDRLALAQAALEAGDRMVATNALEGIPPEDQNSAAFHNIAGNVAAASGLLAEAKAHLREAGRLDPTNPIPRLNLAALQLQDSNTLVLAEARTVLLQLSTNHSLRPYALHELVLDALRGNRTNDAIRLCAELNQTTNCSYADRLLQLKVLQVAEHSSFKPTLAAYQHEVATNAARIFDLAGWQVKNGLLPEALTWLESLPLSYQTNQPLALLLAECRTTAGDFTGLQKTLRPQHWGELDFVRHAFLAHALRQDNLADSSRTEWEQAVKLANPIKERLTMLLRWTAQWRWPSQGEELLWTIVQRYPSEKWAPPLLMRMLFEAGRTRSLMSLFSEQLKTDPANLDLKNNLAMTALLLNAQEIRPYALAHEVYQSASTNASFASTYAFSLHLQGKNQEALKIFQQIAPKDLENSAIAGYYGLVLKATGNPDKAGPFFDQAFKGRLMPEERQMFDKAKKA